MATTVASRSRTTKRKQKFVDGSACCNARRVKRAGLWFCGKCNKLLYQRDPATWGERDQYKRPVRLDE